MLLRLLAKDLYKSQKKVESLNQQLLETMNNKEQEKIKEELRQANAELCQLQKVMEGRKEQSRASLHKRKSLY